MAYKEYGKVIRTYHGKGNLKLTNGNEIPCYITIQQVETGSIYITCKFSPNVAQASDTIQFMMDSAHQDIEVIYGKTGDGMYFESRRNLFITHTQFTVFSRKPATITLLTQEADLRQEDRCHASCYKFSVVNFEFTGNHPANRVTKDGTKTIEHFYRNLELKTAWGVAVVDPVPDYEDVIRKMKAQNGISVTCEVAVKPSSNMELEEVTSKLDELCRLLSLARGTKITWINTEERREDGTAHRIILRNAVTWPFSYLPLIDPRNPHDTAFFIEKVYPTYLGLCDSYNLDIAIGQLLDAKRGTAYLETRALAAVSLLDFLQGQYASMHGLDIIISGLRGEKNKKLRNYLKEHIMELFPDIEGRDLNEMMKKTSELNRRSYLSLLKLWTNSMGLKMQQGELSKIRDTRISLVHKSRFQSNDSDGKMREYYRIISLIDRAFLKLLDYDGWFMHFNLDTLRLERHMLNHDDSIR